MLERLLKHTVRPEEAACKRSTYISQLLRGGRCLQGLLTAHEAMDLFRMLSKLFISTSDLQRHSDPTVLRQRGAAYVPALVNVRVRRAAFYPRLPVNDMLPVRLHAPKTSGGSLL